MTIAVQSGQDMTKVLSDYHTAALFGFDVAGRRKDWAPSRRIIAEALGLSTAQANMATEASGLAEFVAAVNLALKTHGPRSLVYLGGGRIGWSAPAWNLPTTYLVTGPSSSVADEVDGLEATYSVPVGGTSTYAVRAKTLVGQAQEITLGVAGLAASASGSTRTVYEGRGTVDIPLSVSVTGRAAVLGYVQLLWERQRYSPNDPEHLDWTTTFGTPIDPGVQTEDSFSLRLDYVASRNQSVDDDGIGTYTINVRCNVADGRAPTAGDKFGGGDWDLRPETSITIRQVPAS